MKESQPYDKSGGVPGQSPWETEYWESWEQELGMTREEIIFQYKNGTFKTKPMATSTEPEHIHGLQAPRVL